MVRPARMRHLRAVESWRVVDVHHPPSPASTSTIVTLRCAPSKYQNSGPRAQVSDVQHPSPNFFQVLFREVGDARVRPRKHAAGVPAVGRHVEAFHAHQRRVPDQLALVGRIDRKPRDLREVVLLVLSVPAYTHSLPSAGFCHSAIAKPSASFRRPVPSQLTTKISGGPGTIRLEKTMRSPRGSAWA